jgi:hypothetical protein
MRKLPSSIKEVRMENDISFLGFNLALTGEFSESMKKVSKVTRDMKKSLYPFGAHALT